MSLTASCVLAANSTAISAQIEAAVKACEAETSKAGQDYYSALAGATAPAAKGSAVTKSPATAKGAASAKDEPAAQIEVYFLTHPKAPR